LADKPIKKKQFKIDSSPEYKQAIEYSAAKAAERMLRNESPFSNEEWVAIESMRADAIKQYEEKYPSNPPNGQCQHAIVLGILIDNVFAPKLFEFNHLLDTPLERVFVWTVKENQYSYVISNVSMNVHKINVWRTIGHILKYTEALSSSLENNLEIDYWWIYRFEPTIRWDNQEFIDESWHSQDTIHKLAFFKQNAVLIQLLYSDDTFFYAVQNLVAASEVHSFCQICAYQKVGQRKHQNHEPHIWEYSLFIPQMEIAIVKATKAVEGILGQQGKDKAKARIRCQHNLDIEEDAQFRKTGMTYFEYHAFLIDEVRNKVAHNLRNNPFKVSREMTIDAQTFAWEIVRSYYLKFKTTNEQAFQSLNLNLQLIARDVEGYGTPMTRD
jgi:hypothetical protein